jgi:hypothetical protein
MNRADSPDDVVRLVTAANPPEAHLIEQALRDEGIACRVVGDFLNAGIGDIPGVRPEVWVHRDDVARAEAVLRRRSDEGPGAAGEPGA